MARFFAGLVIGLGLGLVTAALADIVIADGRLFHWTVTKSDIEVCKNPYVWRFERQIEC